MNNTNKHTIKWINNIRFFAVICVVFYHCAILFERKGFDTNIVIEAFNMPLFCFISGYVGWRSIHECDSKSRLLGTLIKLFKRLMLPCLFFLFFEIALRKITRINEAHGFWFLQLMFLLKVEHVFFSFIANKTFNNYYLRLTLPLTCLFFVNMLFSKYNSSELTSYYIVGCFLGSRSYFENTRNIKSLIAIFSFFLFVFLTYKGCYKSFYIFPFSVLLQNRDLDLFIIRQIIGFSFIFFSCYLFKRFFNTKDSGFGGITLGIYIIHEFLLTVLFRPYFHVSNFGFYSWVAYVLFSLFLLCLSIFIVKLSAKNKLTELLVLGRWNAK